ncbi:TniB family NTP-binding protein [Micromonospora inyonensis]|uniref:AAA domain-containing protein n=1 Tax=Micromonospora inyonensis TaxID=47866 RepID=A0A1C6RKR1_9ACTN|nr:TniB family NTP-binding protein [Micromonospora inyonensis]SCL17755.1 AAA domain-containing protein [Micromonospora inyonensis]
MTGAGDLYTLSRKEGWRRWVDAAARVRPDPLTAGQLRRLGTDARADYDDARHDWHANFGTIKTPQLAGIHDELDQIVATNRQDPDRVRGAAVIDALPGLGKTTIANTFARDFDRAQRRRHGERTNAGHERLPVFRVGLTSRTTLRTLNRMICEFYGHPGTDRANAAQLASFAVDCVLSCHTRVGIIDDLHFIDPNRRDGVDVANHLKWLANELPVTFVYAGVGLAERRLLAEGLTGDSAVMAQTARRWTRLELPPFQVAGQAGRRHWRSLLKATERQLVLADARPGMLSDLETYLFARSSGHIGSFITLITRGCYKAIRSGEETLDQALLDTIRIDEASEAARHQLQATLSASRRPRRPAPAEAG